MAEDLKESIAFNLMLLFLKKQRGERYVTAEGVLFSAVSDEQVLVSVPGRNNPTNSFFKVSKNLKAIKEFAEEYGFVITVDIHGCPFVEEVKR